MHHFIDFTEFSSFKIFIAVDFEELLLAPQLKVDWAWRISLQVCKIKFASSFFARPAASGFRLLFFLTSGFILEEFYSASISIWVWWRHILNSCICVKCQCLLVASLSWGHSEASRHCIFIFLLWPDFFWFVKVTLGKIWFLFFFLTREVNGIVFMQNSVVFPRVFSYLL